MKKSYRVLDGYAWIMAAVLLAIIILSALCGCGSKKKVTEQVYVHDTLIVRHTDTVRVESIKTKTDTLRELRMREVTLMRDTAGNIDTVRIETVSNYYQYIYEGDSSSVYRVAVDNILRALDRQREKEAIKTAPAVDWWHHIVFLSLIFLALYFVSRRK